MSTPAAAAAAAAAAFQTAADLCAETDFVPCSKLLKTSEEGESRGL